LARLVATEIIPIRHQAANMAFSKTSIYSYYPESVNWPILQRSGSKSQTSCSLSTKHSIPE